MAGADPGVRIGVDIGGTFTDIVLERGPERITAKVLTTPDAPEEGVRQALAQAMETCGVAPADVALVIHGTTLATNALIERKGARTALVTTEGFRDSIEMGTESRFEQYDIDMEKPVPLVPRQWRFPIPERLNASGEPILPLDEGAVEATAAQGSLPRGSRARRSASCTPTSTRRTSAVCARSCRTRCRTSPSRSPRRWRRRCASTSASPLPAPMPTFSR